MLGAMGRAMGDGDTHAQTDLCLVTKNFGDGELGELNYERFTLHI